MPAMFFARFRSRRARLLAAAIVAPLALLAVWAWMRAAPRIGDPFVAPETREPALWTFGFVGDTQLGEEVTEQIFSRMEGAGVEFALHLGDLVDEAASDDEWDTLVERARRHRIRMLPVVGNHDRLRDRVDHGEVRWRQYFPELPGTFYHVRHRGLNLLMLNSERSLAPWSEQAAFIRWQLSHHPGTTIVCLHRPVFTCGQRDWARQWLHRVWLHGLLAGSDTVAVLCGHNHYYDRTWPLDGITYVVSGGASRKLYEAEATTAITARFEAGRNHYGLVDVHAEHLHVRVLDLAGSEMDAFDLPLRPSPYEPGHERNRLSRELPPLETVRWR